SMSLDELDKLDRQRRDADARYNEALTAFDAALVRETPAASSGLAADGSIPAAPSGLGGWPARAVAQWLTPWSERQPAVNAGTAEVVDVLIARERERTDAFARFQAALIGFAQQITAFVETKDRQMAAQVTQRLDGHQRLLEQQQPLLETLPEMRAQIAVAQ